MDLFTCKRPRKKAFYEVDPCRARFSFEKTRFKIYLHIRIRTNTNKMFKAVSVFAMLVKLSTYCIMLNHDGLSIILSIFAEAALRRKLNNIDRLINNIQ